LQNRGINRVKGIISNDTLLSILPVGVLVVLKASPKENVSVLAIVCVLIRLSIFHDSRMILHDSA